MVESAKSVLGQWKNVQDKFFDSSIGFMTQVDGEERWSVPNENTIKVNIDAAIFETSQCFSYSAVARDDKGELIEAISKCERGNITAEVVEAIGIREAISWIKKKGWTRIIVETDCMVVVQAIRSSAAMLSYFGRVIEQFTQALEELKEHEVSLRFVKRSVNNVAHFLARHTCSVADRVWRMGFVHSEFLDVLMNDLKSY